MQWISDISFVHKNVSYRFKVSPQKDTASEGKNGEFWVLIAATEIDSQDHSARNFEFRYNTHTISCNVITKEIDPEICFLISQHMADLVDEGTEHWY